MAETAQKGKIVYSVASGNLVSVKIHTSFRITTSPKPETVGDLYLRHLLLSRGGEDNDANKIDVVGLQVASAVVLIPGVTDILISQYELSFTHSPAMEIKDILLAICVLIYNKFQLRDLAVYNGNTLDAHLSIPGKNLLSESLRKKEKIENFPIPLSLANL